MIEVGSTVVGTVVAVVFARVFDSLEPDSRYTESCKVVCIKIVQVTCYQYFFNYLLNIIRDTHGRCSVNPALRNFFSDTVPTARPRRRCCSTCSSLTDASSVCDYRRCTSRGCDSYMI